MRPGYKQTEVGVVPNAWEVKRLGDLFQFRNGVNADKSAYGKGYRFVNVLEPISHSHLFGSEIPGRVSIPDWIAATYAVRRGDVLFNRTSETDTELGLASTYLGSEHVVFGGFVIRGRPVDGNLDPVYSGYALRAPAIRAQVIPLGQGAVRANIGQERLCQVLTLIPPLPEQRAIAAALSDADALLEGLTRLIAKKRNLKQAAMQQLLTGRTRLPGFRGEWEPADFGDVAAIRNVKVVPSSMPAGTRCVELESIGQGSGRLLGSADATGSSTKYSFTKGDVLFGRLRAYLRKYWLATFDGICSTEIWPLTPRDGRLCERFLHLLVQTDAFIDAAGVSYGTHMPRSDWSVLKKLPVQVPSLTEQSAIAAVLSDMDAALAALEARRDKTRALKQAMMQALLTGRTRLVDPPAPDR